MDGKSEHGNKGNEHRVGHKASDEVKLKMSVARYDDWAVKRWLKKFGFTKKEAAILLKQGK